MQTLPTEPESAHTPKPCHALGVRLAVPALDGCYVGSPEPIANVASAGTKHKRHGWVRRPFARSFGMRSTPGCRRSADEVMTIERPELRIIDRARVPTMVAQHLDESGRLVDILIEE